MKPLVDPRFAKGKMYSKVIAEINEAKVCPFCPKNFKWHTNPILRREKSWLITKSFNSYKNAKHHFIILCKSHKERFQELTQGDWKQISSLINWAIRTFKLPGGGVAMRFGDTKYTGATVVHLHLHLIIPRIRNNKALPVYFPFG